MQFPVGSSLLSVSRRCLNNAAAQGWNGRSLDFNSEVMLMNCRVVGCQTPAISVLPSGLLGAGADRFGLSSGSRGMSGVRIFSHCAEASPQARMDALHRVAERICDSYQYTALESDVRFCLELFTSRNSGRWHWPRRGS